MTDNGMFLYEHLTLDAGLVLDNVILRLVYKNESSAPRYYEYSTHLEDALRLGDMTVRMDADTGGFEATYQSVDGITVPPVRASTEALARCRAYLMYRWTLRVKVLAMLPDPTPEISRDASLRDVDYFKKGQNLQMYGVFQDLQREFSDWIAPIPGSPECNPDGSTPWAVSDLLAHIRDNVSKRVRKLQDELSEATRDLSRMSRRVQQWERQADVAAELLDAITDAPNWTHAHRNGAEKLVAVFLRRRARQSGSNDEVF